MNVGLIVNGTRVPVYGVRVVTWEDDPRVPRAVHGGPRAAEDVTASIVHTSRGVVAKVARETGTAEKGLKVARYLGRSNAREVSAHLVVAGDGTVYQLADLALWKANHAGQVNGFTFGVEIAQDDDDASLTRAQVRAFVAMMNVAHDALKIPKTIPMDGARHIGEDVRAWLRRSAGGEEQRFAGCAGHRNTSTSRGLGDPGDAPMEALRVAGFVGALPSAMACLRGGRCADVDRPEDVEPARPAAAIPSWLDPSLEIDATHDLPDDFEAFARTQGVILARLGVIGERAAELIAHAATETGRGRRAHAYNLGGAKAKERDYVAAKAAGHPLSWWRDLGHVDSGDDDVEYYRAFESSEQFWRWFMARHTGTDALTRPNSDRYALVGPAFWGPRPATWFVELLRAGYRGEVRQAEIRAMADPSAHPSVVAHRALVARVLELHP